MDLEALIPLAAVLLIFGTPIIAILTKHQRQMAELIHSRQSPAINPETQAIREELRELKQLVYQQSIAIDNLARPLPSKESEIQSRIG
jgi:hypothetical protein